jgi:hypothetical protein
MDPDCLRSHIIVQYREDVKYGLAALKKEYGKGSIWSNKDFFRYVQQRLLSFSTHRPCGPYLDSFRGASEESYSRILFLRSRVFSW